MGIRFFCPNGHKLNVKEFQAGRRGICPFCGARIQIPTQSTRPSSKSVGRRGIAHATTQIMERDDLESTQASDSSPDILPGEPPSLPGDPTSGKMLGPSTPLGIPPGSGPVIAPPAALAGGQGTAAAPPSALPTVGGDLRTAPARQPSPAPALGPVQPAPVAPAPAPVVPAAPVTSSGPPAPAGPAASSAPAAPSVPASFSAPAASSQPDPPEAVDPIAEAPEAIWYVRPPSGGQFGPASGDLMRTWLSEGRVSADSLVWREGWRDWQEAGRVFPKLRGNQVMDFLETAPVATVATSPAAHVHRVKVKRSSDRNQVALLVVLSLAVVVLLFVFLWEIFKQ